jgi:uncharacterized damage-inducible protein DinB
MMTKQQLTPSWDHLRQVHGMGMRVIEIIPADKIDARPIPNMRTTKELVVHTYAQAVREIAEGMVRGEIRQVDEAPINEGIKTHADLVRFAKDQWAAADRAVSQITDAHLSGIVKTPWGFEAPGFVMIGLIHDEYLHHRGQLYAYARAFGQAPPMMWDFEHNAPEYQPKQAVQG